MEKFRHWAYCPETGEVIGCMTGNALKRAIRRNIAWDIKHGYPKKKWRFYHGAYEGLPTKSFA